MESTIIKGSTSSNQENDMEKVLNSKEMLLLHTPYHYPAINN